MPRRNRIEDLRDHLFETLEALKDTDKPLDVERAKQICNVSRQIIDSAKVETKYAEVTGAELVGEFFDAKPGRRPALPTGRPNGHDKSDHTI